MVRINFNINQRLKAVSIIETLVAMVILTISLGIAFMIFMNVISNNSVIVKTRAKVIAQEVAQEAIEEERWLNEELEIQNFIIQKKIRPSNNANNLLLLQVTVFKGQEKITTHHQLIPNIQTQKK